VACPIALLIGCSREEVSISAIGRLVLSPVGMMFGYRRSCMLIALICLTLAWLPIALSQEIDEGEFSRPMLGYKLQLLQAEFKQTEMTLSARIVALTLLKKLEHVSGEIKRLEAEFQCGRYYPDLLDEQIVINREELRLILINVLMQKPIEI
jgi:hypothetical protein